MSANGRKLRFITLACTWTLLIMGGSQGVSADSCFNDCMLNAAYWWQGACSWESGRCNELDQLVPEDVCAMTEQECNTLFLGLQTDECNEECQQEECSCEDSECESVSFPVKRTVPKETDRRL